MEPMIPQSSSAVFWATRRLKGSLVSESEAEVWLTDLYPFFSPEKPKKGLFYRRWRYVAKNFGRQPRNVVIISACWCLGSWRIQSRVRYTEWHTIPQPSSLEVGIWVRLAEYGPVALPVSSVAVDRASWLTAIA